MPCYPPTTQAPSDVKTVSLKQVLDLCQSASTYTVFQDGELHIYQDDYEANRRVIWRVDHSRKYATKSVLTGYDKDKHCWREYITNGERYDIPNKRGNKQLQAWLDERNTLFHYYPRPKIAVYYRRNGELRP